MDNDIFLCPHCQAKFKRDRVKPGAKFKCSKCKNIVEAPPEEEEMEDSGIEEAASFSRVFSSSAHLSDEDKILMSEDTLLDADSPASKPITTPFKDDFKNTSDEHIAFDEDIVNATMSDEDEDEDIFEDSGVLSPEDFEDSDSLEAEKLDDSGVLDSEAFDDSGVLETEGFDDSGVLSAEGLGSDSNAYETFADSSATLEPSDSNLEQNFQQEIEHRHEEEFATQPHSRDNFNISSAGISAEDSESAAEAILKGHPLHSSSINQLSLSGQHLPSVHISDSRFSTLEITNTVIDGDFRLSQVNCAKYLKLTNVTIKGELVIHGGTYSGEVHLNSCRIYGATQCSESEFNGSFFWSKSQFHQPILLTTCQFKSDAKIVQSQILQECSIKECRFSGLFSLDQSLFKGVLDLETASFDGPISLRKTIADYLQVSPLPLKKPLQSQKEKDPQLNLEQFAFLMEHFRKKGNPAQQDWAYRQYQKARRKTLSLKNPLNWIRRPLDWLLFDLGMGYGTRPLLTLMNLFLIFLCYTGGYFSLLEKMPNAPTGEEQETHTTKMSWKLPLPSEQEWIAHELGNKIFVAMDYSLQNMCFRFPTNPPNPFLEWIYMSQALLNLFFFLLCGFSLQRGLSR